MKNGRKFGLAALGIMLFSLLTGCNQKAPQPTEKIVLGTQAIAYTAPVWIAENQGYFREEGLDVEIKEFSSGQAALQTMLNAKGLDLVTASQTPVIVNSFHRNDYAIIAGLVYSDRDIKLLARQDQGIKAPADLKGKRVGITASTSSHFFLSLFLTDNRMQISDVKIVDLEPARLSSALIEGQVDAIVTWEPHIYLTRKILGEKAFLFPSQGLYRVDVYFITRKDYLKEYPENLKRFLRAIEKSEAFILKNGKEAREIVRKRLKIDAEVMEAAWAGLLFRLFLDQSILISLEDHSRWAIRNRLTDAKTEPNYLDYVYSEALKTVKPGAVSLAGR